MPRPETRLRAARLRRGDERRLDRVVDEVEDRASAAGSAPHRPATGPAVSEPGGADGRAVHDEVCFAAARAGTSRRPSTPSVIVVPDGVSGLSVDHHAHRSSAAGGRPRRSRWRPPRSAPARRRALRRRCRGASCACPSRRSRRLRAASARSRRRRCCGRRACRRRGTMVLTAPAFVARSLVPSSSGTTASLCGIVTLAPRKSAPRSALTRPSSASGVGVPRLVRGIDAGGVERRLEDRRADRVPERMSDDSCALRHAARSYCPLVLLDVPQVLFERLGEDVRAVALRDEEQIVRLRRPHHRLDRVEARVGDRPGRQARVDVRIVRRIDLEVVERQLLLPVAVLRDARRDPARAAYCTVGSACSGDAERAAG